jgi:hypothetical protein
MRDAAKRDRRDEFGTCASVDEITTFPRRVRRGGDSVTTSGIECGTIE